jgi:hypothetical protein
MRRQTRPECWLLVEGIMPDLRYLVDVLVEDGVRVLESEMNDPMTNMLCVFDPESGVV